MTDVKRQCPVCGSENLEGESKCSNCGERLPTSASAIPLLVQASSAPRHLLGVDERRRWRGGGFGCSCGGAVRKYGQKLGHVCCGLLREESPRE